MYQILRQHQLLAYGICPDMIPILHSPGVIIPGQLGPISLDSELSIAFPLTISNTGIPSVIATINGIFASIHSRIESAKPRRNKYHGCIGACFIDCLISRVKYRMSFVNNSTFTWGYSSNKICSVIS